MNPIKSHALKKVITTPNESRAEMTQCGLMLLQGARGTVPDNEATCHNCLRVIRKRDTALSVQKARYQRALMGNMTDIKPDMTVNNFRDFIWFIRRWVMLMFSRSN